jgi:hypothetical protein
VAVRDKNGKNVDVGHRVWFVGHGGTATLGTIRSVGMVGETYEAWVDDGDPDIADPRKNRMRVRQRVRSEDITREG